MSKERRLGRGLEALLGRADEGPLDATGAPALRVVADDGTPAGAGLALVSVGQVDPNPFQPRRDFDPAQLADLAGSIREHGILQPLVMRRAGNRYQIIAGERRWRAAQQAGLAEVPAQVREADDRQMAEIAIVENLQRRDLNALEKAASFQGYLSRYGGTQEELAGRLQIDRSTVANLIRLLELPDTVQELVRRSLLTPGHARALLPLGDEGEQVAFAERIVREGLSVRATEAAVQDQIAQADHDPLGVLSPDEQASLRGKSGRRKSGHLASLEQQLRTALGTRVDLRENSQGRGRIVIHFASHDEFDRLQRHLTHSPGRSKAG